MFTCFLYNMAHIYNRSCIWPTKTGDSQLLVSVLQMAICKLLHRSWKTNFWSRRGYRAQYSLLNPEQSGNVLDQFKSTTMAQTTGWFPPCRDKTFYYMTADIQKKCFRMHSKRSYWRCMGPVSRGCFFQGWSNRRGQKTVAVLQSIATCSATKMTLPNTGQTKRS